MPSNLVPRAKLDMREFAVRGSIFHTTGDPAKEPNPWLFLEDGVLVISNGRIKHIHSAQDIVPTIEQSIPIYHYSDCLICPGFVDSHVHYAQTRVIGSPASGLLEWLETHTFPEELQFENEEYASTVVVEFFDELVRNGTTSALVYPTVHFGSTDQFFAESYRRGLRMMGGKVLMDRNAPTALRDCENYGMDETEVLIKKWHGSGRLSYSVTLRFAGTSTFKQMQACGNLVANYPELLFHTHLSETLSEIDWTLGLYPKCHDYLSVYEEYGLVTDHSIFAHCIHLSDSECERLADSGSSASLLPHF